ncbi:disulfide bond formation protein DsbA [Phyllobacterium phragmitis]|uniref:Disulfide bond formation protein DsbA n=1 Tax=Phyllobacterium phragmitis TaxID=2670329 RepID=A0A2S9IJM4_9HYPH|nr:DsbA family protein [Phyllobacterium phragmitis]PRD40730.1 disulfide bond formation protein DsbA [Phyllobacterium phragmitis]
MPTCTRRSAIFTFGGAVLSLPFLGQIAIGQEIEVTKEMILNDPEAPVGGNPNGDVTIVNFTDYNCPYCKKVAPILARVIKEDGKIRQVYKDWPVIRPTSIEGAQLAIAAKYQGKYEVAHDALMKIPGSGISKEQMRAALQAAGIDMKRLDRDMAAHRGDIFALIKRNMAQGDALGLTGTPSFLIGPFRASTLDYQGFKQVIADARKAQAESR